MFTILSYTPKLHRLQCIFLSSPDSSIKRIMSIRLTFLTHIVIKTCNLHFNYFALFNKKIDCKLKSLFVITESQDINFLNAYEWQNLINQALPRLRRFYLRYTEENDNEMIYYVHSDKQNAFSSSFWIERNLTFSIQYDGELIHYLVRPYRYIENIFFFI
jgi:hypothetical protein